MTPQDRLAAALNSDYDCCTIHDEIVDASDHVAARALAADPTIAADMELGRRIRDANDPLLRNALTASGAHPWTPPTNALRAALTEGEKGRDDR